jgi:hypothetical protein
MEDNIDKGLQYLDKEMTIMGLLSTFCLAVPSLIIERLASATNSNLATVWCCGWKYFCSASVLMLFSALLFYKQRSLLAFYYGRIAIDAKPLPNSSDTSLETWMSWADSWTTWIPYHIAFWIGGFAIFEYIFAFLSHKCDIIRNIFCFLGVWFPIISIFLLTIAVFVFLKDRRILYEENAWVDGWKRRFRRKH